MYKKLEQLPIQKSKLKIYKDKLDPSRKNNLKIYHRQVFQIFGTKFKILKVRDMHNANVVIVLSTNDNKA